MRRCISEFITLQTGVNIPYLLLELLFNSSHFSELLREKTPDLEKILEFN
jgi:hypothetical protein